jgi:threonine dehydrogenase-like Zn-dependent dehydrogenase
VRLVPGRESLDEWFKLGLDVVAEVTGTASALDMAGRMTKAHGQLNIVGYHHQDLPRHINMHMWNWKGFTVVNCHDRRFWYNIKYMDAALNLIKRGRLNVDALMTHGFDFKDINQAFSAMANKPKGYIKGYVKIN